MSKYEALWKHILESKADGLTLTFDEIEGVCGILIDHSFLNYKKELEAYGYRVGKISLKNQTVQFERSV